MYGEVLHAINPWKMSDADLEINKATLFAFYGKEIPVAARRAIPQEARSGIHE